MLKKKSSRIRQQILILVQALSLAALGITIVFYLLNARLYISKDGIKDNEHRIASLGELRSNYYDSEIYVQNLKNTLDDIGKLVVIKEQLENAGQFDGSKLINIGEYAYRDKNEVYSGPLVYYYLEDLISWEQSGFNHKFHTFDSFEQMDEFFSPNVSYVLSSSGIDKKNSESSSTDKSSAEQSKGIIEYDKTTSSAEDKGNQVPTLDMITEEFKNSDGKELIECAKSAEEYSLLCSVLEESAEKLYKSYTNYQLYNDFYSTDKSNVKFYVSFGSGKNKKVYSNLINARTLSDEVLPEYFKSLGEYLYVDLDNMEFLTNTPLYFDAVKDSFNSYDRLFFEDCSIWMGIDTTYPVDDVYYDNYHAYKDTIHKFPWIVTGVCIALIIFIALLVANTGFEIRYFKKENKEELSDFDKLHIEVEFLFYILLATVVYISCLIVMDGMNIWTLSLKTVLILPLGIFMFLFTYIGLQVFYTIVRRISSENFWDKSFFAWIIRNVFFKNNTVKRFWWRIYDESSVAVRTWSKYLLFMVYNTFWACMLFFSTHPVLSFLALLIFDTISGFYLFLKNVEQKKIVDGIRKINTGEYDYKIDTSKMHGDTKSFAEAVNDIGNGLKTAVETSTRDEKLKADLITNVSHDLKTPLTSIVNYVDLIKREKIDNEKVNEYVRILDEKSQRLKQLTMDLLEASKVTSGNITLELEKINFTELLYQSEGEFEEKFEEKGLSVVKCVPNEPVMILADPRRMWRIIENLYGNIYKYALENTRVYLDLSRDTKNNTMILSIKNVSKNQLNFAADELTERFIRGDVARSTEGSGLGLSIAKSLTQAHNGKFDIYLDGDLFKVTLTFPLVSDNLEMSNE